MLIDTIVSTIAGNGEIGYKDGIGSVSMFYHPTGITIDKKRRVLFVVDTGNNRIRRIDNSMYTLFYHHWKQLKLLWLSFKKPTQGNYLSLLPLDIIKYM